MSLLKQTKKFHIIAMRIMSERGPSSYHGWVHIPREIRKLEEKESIHSVENITLLQNTCWLASNHIRAYHVKEVHWKSENICGLEQLVPQTPIWQFGKV